MHCVPPRSPLLVVASYMGSFLGGPVLGILVARWVAPGSEFAQLVSFFAFPLAFVGGLALWFGIGVAAVLVDALYRLVRGRWRWRSRPSSVQVLVPPGYPVFLPLATLLGFASGVLVGLTAESSSFLMTSGVYLVAGGAYGAILRALAHHGYLPFPEPG